MNRPFPVIAGMLLILFACEEKNHSQGPGRTTASIDSAKSTTRYFPVMAFLKSEIEYVDSLPVGIKKFTVIGNHQDSGYIQLKEFHKLAGEFLSAELNDSAFARDFTETSFFDQSSNTATFLYKARDENLLTRRIDVITMKTDVYDEVKSIYIEKDVRSGDSLINKKLMWRPKKNFQVISAATDSKGNMGSQLIKVVWDNGE
jgi:hypothetical protein